MQVAIKTLSSSWVTVHCTIKSWRSSSLRISQTYESMSRLDRSKSYLLYLEKSNSISSFDLNTKKNLNLCNLYLCSPGLFEKFYKSELNQRWKFVESCKRTHEFGRYWKWINLKVTEHRVQYYGNSNNIMYWTKWNFVFLTQVFINFNELKCAECTINSLLNEIWNFQEFRICFLLSIRSWTKCKVYVVLYFFGHGLKILQFQWTEWKLLIIVWMSCVLNILPV